MKSDLRLVRSMPAQRPGQSKQDYETPKNFLGAVRRRFGEIDLDLAATNENAKGRFWITPEEDSLSDAIDWDLYYRKGCRLAFLNPPFGKIQPWARKCSLAETLPILFLVPASVGANWWAFDVDAQANLVLFLRPRLSFDGKNPYPKDCALVGYNLREINPSEIVHTRYECWDWSKR